MVPRITIGERESRYIILLSGSAIIHNPTDSLANLLAMAMNCLSRTNTCVNMIASPAMTASQVATCSLPPRHAASGGREVRQGRLLNGPRRHRLGNCEGKPSLNAKRQPLTPCRATLVPTPAPLAPAPQEDEFKFTKFDIALMTRFRMAMAKELGQDSALPGYAGLMDIARKLLSSHSSREESEDAAVRILYALFPPWLLPLFRKMFLPIADGKLAAIMTAWVTKWTCTWLMGKCEVNEIDTPGGKLRSGLKVEKCRYLEQSGCAGVCVHTCKFPTQRFITEGMGIPLQMEPNYQDYSCQFKFGVPATERHLDQALLVGCLSICPTANALKAAQLPEQCVTVTLPEDFVKIETPQK
eukprot:jgi/Mesvir1/8855/Mv02751-RA.1